MNRALGERVWAAKLTEDQARQIRKLAIAGEFSLNEIARMFGVSKRMVLWIKQGRKWRHLWQSDELEVNPDQRKEQPCVDQEQEVVGAMAQSQ
jgi:DNA invertase Pin-like site-specific DNA recombinase